jgi:hypothetical protein
MLSLDLIGRALKMIGHLDFGLVRSWSDVGVTRHLVRLMTFVLWCVVYHILYRMYIYVLRIYLIKKKKKNVSLSRSKFYEGALMF